MARTVGREPRATFNIPIAWYAATSSLWPRGVARLVSSWRLDSAIGWSRETANGHERTEEPTRKKNSRWLAGGVRVTSNRPLIDSRSRFSAHNQSNRVVSIGIADWTVGESMKALSQGIMPLSWPYCSINEGAKKNKKRKKKKKKRSRPRHTVIARSCYAAWNEVARSVQIENITDRITRGKRFRPVLFISRIDYQLGETYNYIRIRD